MKNKRVRSQEEKRIKGRFIDNKKPSNGQRSSHIDGSNIEQDLDGLDLYKNFDKFGNIKSRPAKGNRTDTHEPVDDATENTESEFDSISTSKSVEEMHSDLADTDASDLLSDLEEYDEGDFSSSLEESERDDNDDDLASIAYSSSEGEEGEEYFEDDNSLSSANKEMEIISKGLLLNWRTELNTRPTFLLIRKILRQFEKSNFDLVSLTEKNGGKLVKTVTKIAQSRTVELEDETSCSPIFYEIVFTMVPSALSKLLIGKEIDQNLGPRIFKPNCHPKWGRQVRIPIKQFLDRLFLFLDRQVAPDSWQILYVLKYGIIQYMPYILPFPALLKRLIRILVNKWSMTTVFKGDDELTSSPSSSSSLKKFTKLKGSAVNPFHEKERIQDRETGELQAIEQEVRLLCFILLRRISHLPMGNDNLLEIVLKLSYLALMRSNLGNATMRTRLAPFLLQSLVDLYMDQTTCHSDQAHDQIDGCRTDRYLQIENRRRQREIYKIGFVFIRELAIYLRKYVHNPAEDHAVHLVSWQFVIACKFWGNLFGAIYQEYLGHLRAAKKASKVLLRNEELSGIQFKKDSDPLQEPHSIRFYPAMMLIYPLQQIIFGVLSMLPRPALFPFHLQLLEIVLSMGKLMQPNFPISMKQSKSILTTGDENGFLCCGDGTTSDPSASFIDVAGVNHLGVSMICLDMLFSLVGKRKSTNSALSRPELMKLLRVSADYVGTRLYAETLSATCIDFIRRDLILSSSNIAFPSISWVFVKRARLLIKHYANFPNPMVKDLQGILEAVQQQSNWITLKLREFGISDLSSIIDSAVSLPLHHYRFVNAAGFSFSRSPLADILKSSGFSGSTVHKK